MLADNSVSCSTYQKGKIKGRRGLDAEPPGECQNRDCRCESLIHTGVKRRGRKGFGNVERASVARFRDVKPRVVAAGQLELTLEPCAAAGVFVYVGIIGFEGDGDAIVFFFGGLSAEETHGVD